MDDKRQRQQHILELLARNRVESQEELRELLDAEGVRTAQSTLSRDLRELGVVKGSAGYRIPLRDAAGPDRLRALRRSIGPLLHSVDWGGNLVVLRVSGGEHLREVAARIEAARLHQSTAALVCDDAVLIVARSAAYAREIVHTLRERPRRARRRRPGS